MRRSMAASLVLCAAMAWAQPTPKADPNRAKLGNDGYFDAYTKKDAPTAGCRPDTNAILDLQHRRPGFVYSKWGGPQGVFLEGEGLELLSFDGFRVEKASGKRRQLTYKRGEQLNACLNEYRESVLTEVGPCRPLTRDTWSCVAKAEIPVCGVPAGGDLRVVVVPGVWDKKGLWSTSKDRFTVSCDSAWGADSGGAVAGCLTRFHLVDPACVRAYRADYCGDGFPHTKADTWIDMGKVGPRTPDDPERTDMELEATWDAAGAVMVHHQRWKPLNKEFVNLEKEEECPAKFVKQADGTWLRPNAGKASLETAADVVESKKK